MEIIVLYHPKVLTDDLVSIPKAIKTRIKNAIEKKLLTYPETFGEPLRGSLVPLWKLRVGDYRIVYGFTATIVYVHAIGHRKHIYSKVASKRSRTDM
jgi:mRNA-degrading endonuclease RelE of RelBE toxin-antitoxin system